MISLQKAGGLAALIIATSYIMGLIVFGIFLNPDDAPDADTLLAFLIDNKSLYYITILILYVLGGLSMAVLVQALNERLQTGSPVLMKISTVFGLIWAAIILVAGMLYLTGLNHDLYNKNPSQAATVWLAISIVFEGLGGGTELVGGLWTLLVSRVTLHTKVFPKILSYLGLLVGIIGIMTIIPAFETYTAVFGLGQIPWFIGIGVILLKSSIIETTAYYKSNINLRCFSK